MSQSTGKVLLTVLHTLLHWVHLHQGKTDRTHTAKWLLQAESIKSLWTSLCLPSQIPYWSVLCHVPWDWLVRDGNSFPLMYGKKEQCEASYRHHRFHFLCFPFYTKAPSQKMWQKAVVYFTLVGGYIPILSLVLVHSSLYTRRGSSHWAHCLKVQMLLSNLDIMVSMPWKFMLVNVIHVPSSLCFKEGGVLEGDTGAQLRGVAEDPVWRGGHGADWEGKCAPAPKLRLISTTEFQSKSVGDSRSHPRR